MPISRDEFKRIDRDDPPRLDLAPDTTQGEIYRFLLRHADRAYRQREIADALAVPKGSIGPTLSRLEANGLVDHRDRFWTVSDAEHAVASAGLHAAATVDDDDGGFSDADRQAWMEAAVDPIDQMSGEDEA